MAISLFLPPLVAISLFLPPLVGGTEGGGKNGWKTFSSPSPRPYTPRGRGGLGIGTVLIKVTTFIQDTLNHIYLKPYTVYFLHIPHPTSRIQHPGSFSIWSCKHKENLLKKIIMDILQGKLPPVPIKREDVHLWFAFPDDIHTPELLEKYHGLINEEENKKCGRYKFENSRHTCLITRALVRTTLSPCCCE